nr:hypothetical protein [Desulforamulus aquiferis]
MVITIKLFRFLMEEENHVWILAKELSIPGRGNSFYTIIGSGHDYGF